MTDQSSVTAGKEGDEDEDRGSRLNILAKSILDESTISLSDLNSAIVLFSKSLDQRPASPALRSESLMDLATALIMRFSLIGQRQDFSQAVSLRAEALEPGSVPSGSGQTQFHVRVQSTLLS